VPRLAHRNIPNDMSLAFIDMGSPPKKIACDGRLALPIERKYA
jgi:hypothetical protein